MNFPQKRQFGFIAQELQTEYPELVYTDDQGISYVDYDKMSAILVECVKDLKKIVEKQQQTIEKQQKQIDDMNERFNSN